ncbi:MAG: PolyA polymerase [Parcubacteria group bacterium GW2011_GWC1_45_13]|uniref:PolyA polymerase n=2 Tax=Patescibacteria group TaxID=1783273 RepID=A0A0G1LUY6_9BACT|nr:MAG: PolyA polymerase [Candidatus Giovannonibacteria bacterium GW2011_GWA1_44_29]KKT91298.1 MAG: PolyA polymerase [Parcubacteria group bacterium GW2011_GWC1_45_13]KKU29820.1 MAG: PolyA polymerase [Candidatus Giovannonibacteria bacterium GW2011_GWB1_46_20]KKU82799.1 MAG: PolyA polymerase [Candidatus Amesbacteria bacterium GW2011_GWC2_47_8]
MNFTIPKEVRAALAILDSAGFEAYLVGGCVRDLLIGRTPQDWDITTNAKPEKIQGLFPKSFYENKFGTVSVVTDSENPRLRTIEITPYRLEGKYSDKRHPDEVKFADKLEEDLARRDFTINAMAMKFAPSSKSDFEIPKKSDFFPGASLIDPFGGQQDLEKKLIRAVGDPNERFEEDALRIMRAVRLAAELDFQIDENTKKALMEKARLLDVIAKERIRDEFSKIIMSQKPSLGIEMLREFGILKLFLPELEEGYGVGQNKHHIYTVWEHNLRSLDHAAKEKWPLVVRMSALFHDIGKPRAKRGNGPNSTFYNHEVIGEKMSAQVLSRLKYGNDFVEKVAKLVRYHLFYYNVDEVTDSSVRRLISRVGPEDMEDLIRVRICDRIGSGVPKAEPYKLRHFRFLVEKLQRDPITVTMLKINGNKIMEIAGVQPGPKVGMILNALMDEVLDSPDKNTEEYLGERTKELSALAKSKLKKLAEAGKTKRLGLEEEEVSKIKKKHYVK